MRLIFCNLKSGKLTQYLNEKKSAKNLQIFEEKKFYVL